MGFFNQRSGNSQAPKSAEEAMRMVHNDLAGCVAQTKYQIPQSAMGDEKAMVMHLIESGQVPQGVLKMIMPAVNRLLGK